MPELAKRVLERLRRERGETPPEPRCLTPDEVAVLTLEDFATRSLSLQVYSELLGREVWFVSSESEAHILLAQGASRGDIFTATELMDLFEVFQRDPKNGLAVIEAKAIFDGQLSLERDAKRSNNGEG